MAAEVSACVHVSYKEQLAVVTAECYYNNEGSSRLLGLFFCPLTARQIIPMFKRTVYFLRLANCET